MPNFQFQADVAMILPTDPHVLVSEGPTGTIKAMSTGLLPSGGGTGTPGLNGWTAVLANESDGQRIVQKVTEWIGGTGTKPAINKYVGPTGFVDTAAAATDIRGAKGADGTSGGGTGTISTTVAYIDAALGNDSTATVGTPSKPYKTITAALIATAPNPVVLELSIGTYAAPADSQQRANVWYKGSGVPKPNWTVTQASFSSTTRTSATKLLGGTLIQGGMNFVGIGGIKLSNLGVDNGPDWIAAGNLAKNGLGFYAAASNEANNTPAPPYTLVQGVEVENVIVIAGQGNWHGLVIESVDKPKFTNFTAIGGGHNIAIKTNGYFENLWAYDGNVSGIIVKSNDYSVSDGLVINSAHVFGAPTNGLSFYNRSHAKLRNISVNGVFINGGTNGVNAESDFGFGFEGIVLNGVYLNGTTNGFQSPKSYIFSNCFYNGKRFQSPVDIIPALVTTPFTDDFNRANNASTMGDNYAVESGVWGITSNRAYLASENNNNGTGVSVNDIVFQTVDKDNYTMEVTVRLLTSTAIGGLLVRMKDSKSYVFLQILPSDSTLYKNDNENYSLYGGAGAGTSNALNTDLLFKIVCNAGLIEVYKNGVLQMSGTESFNLNARRVGFLVTNGTAARTGDLRFDNLSLY